MLNIVKAFILKEQYVFTYKYRTKDGVRYAFPGGIMSNNEEATASLRQFCLAQIGCSVQVHDLLYVHDSNFGQQPMKELYFECTVQALPTHSTPATFEAEWLPVACLHHYTFEDEAAATFLKDTYYQTVLINRTTFL